MRQAASRRRICRDLKNAAQLSHHPCEWLGTETRTLVLTNFFHTAVEYRMTLVSPFFFLPLVLRCWGLSSSMSSKNFLSALRFGRDCNIGCCDWIGVGCWGSEVVAARKDGDEFDVSVPCTVFGLVLTVLVEVEADAPVLAGAFAAFFLEIAMSLDVTWLESNRRFMGNLAWKPKISRREPGVQMSELSLQC